MGLFGKKNTVLKLCWYNTNDPSKKDYRVINGKTKEELDKIALDMNMEIENYFHWVEEVKQ